MVLIGAGLAIGTLASAIVVAARADRSLGESWVAPAAGAVTSLLTPALILALYLQLIFPDGRAHSVGWDRARRVWLGVAMSISAVLVLQPGDLHLMPGIHNPVGFGPDLRGLFGDQVTPCRRPCDSSAWSAVVARRRLPVPPGGLD